MSEGREPDGRELERDWRSFEIRVVMDLRTELLVVNGIMRGFIPSNKQVLGSITLL